MLEIWESVREEPGRRRVAWAGKADIEACERDPIFYGVNGCKEAFISSSQPIAIVPMERCTWPTTPLNIAYHDTEWGVPVHDDGQLFELLILEGAQAGLSWSTILKKRENYRAAFDQFDPRKIAEYGEEESGRLLQDAGIVRNRLKIAATIRNAQAFLEAQREFGCFDAWIWDIAGGKTLRNRWKCQADLPVRTAVSDAMSRALLQREFKFVGSTICYAFMQATGMVNDHLVGCFRHEELSRKE